MAKKKKAKKSKQKTGHRLGILGLSGIPIIIRGKGATKRRKTT